LARNASTVKTGVAKSVTSSRFSSSGGSVVSWKSTTMRPPSCRTSTVVRGSLSSTTTWPAPSAPRRKSMLQIERLPGATAAAARARRLLPRLRGGRPRRHRRALADQDDDAVAVDACLIRNHRAEVHDDARTAVRFGSLDARERADVGVSATRLEG
jgi:hypothetical protein